MISTAAKVAGSTRIEAALRERGSEDRTVPPERRLELLAGVLAFERLPASVLEELAARLTVPVWRYGSGRGGRG